MDYKLVERVPTADELLALRKVMDWYLTDREALQKGLDHSLYGVCAMAGDQVVGCARVVGDGTVVFYIQDVLVHPEYQGKGTGKAIMQAVMDYVGRNACEGAVVGLMSAKEKEGFYEKFGFWQRPNEHFGSGMTLFWKAE